MGRMARIILPLLLVIAALAGCASIDAEQSRLCRMLLPALFPEREGIIVTASEAGSDRRVVHLAFRAGGDSMQERLLTCRFGGSGYSAAKRDLVVVQIDGIGLSESQLWVLKERWLESAFAVMADPGPPDRRGFFELSRTSAVALQHAIGGLPRLGILALLALATALLYGLIGRINLAFGEFAAMGGILCTMTLMLFTVVGYQNPLALAVFALIVVLATAALAGRAVGSLVLAPLSGGRGQPILVAGVGMLVAVQEGLRLAQGSGTLWLPPAGGDPVIVAASPGFLVQMHPRLIAMVALNAAAIIAVLLLMARSRFGREWQAIADDPVAAQLMGIDPTRVLVLTSALATMLAALAGATISLNYGGMNFTGGTMLGMTGLIAAILGGIGSLSGAIAGALAIGSFQIAWLALHRIEHWELASFTLVTLALILRPGGFFGYADGADRKA
jgi:branched-subunit amino acid ABC-type transport system permease component